MSQQPEQPDRRPTVDMGRIEVVVAPNGDRLLPVEQAARLLRVSADSMPDCVTSASTGEEVPPEVARMLSCLAESVAQQTIGVCQAVPRRLADELEFAALVTPMAAEDQAGPRPDREADHRRARRRLIAGLGVFLLALGMGVAAAVHDGDWILLGYQAALGALAVAWAASVHSARLARQAAAAATDALYFARRPGATP